MESLTNLGWIGKSFTTMFAIVPYLLFFNTFKQAGMKPEVIIFAWLIGCIIGIGLMPFNIGIIKKELLCPGDFYPTIPFLIVVLMGIALGSPANTLMSQAMSTAPNASFVFAIAGLSSAVVFGISPIAKKLSPNLFEQANFNWTNLSGLILLAISISLILYQPTK
jgi:hypothetical protein